MGANCPIYICIYLWWIILCVEVFWEVNYVAILNLPVRCKTKWWVWIRESGKGSHRNKKKSKQCQSGIFSKEKRNLCFGSVKQSWKEILYKNGPEQALYRQMRKINTKDEKKSKLKWIMNAKATCLLHNN